MIKNGRISMAAVNNKNVDHLVEAINDAVIS
jgi:aspartate/tyrosine/aromatic aminotransferase